MTHTLLDSRQVASPAGARLCSVGAPKFAPQTLGYFEGRRGLARERNAASDRYGYWRVSSFLRVDGSRVNLKGVRAKPGADAYSHRDLAAGRYLLALI
jgi:hypothetical protein